MSVSTLNYVRNSTKPFLYIIGYPGFHPPRPGQDEDVLSDKHIKDGFLLPLPVPVSLRLINIKI